jgi:hypothetical protein
LHLDAVDDGCEVRHDSAIQSRGSRQIQQTPALGPVGRLCAGGWVTALSKTPSREP